MSHPILDHALISERYFFPRRAALEGAVEIPIEAGTLRCWRSAPPNERPVLVHFHGNGEIVQDWNGDWVGWIQAQGFEVFFAEYRGYGASDGVPQLAAMLDDVSAIVQAVGVPSERQIAFGRSIGSLYAAEMVVRFPSTAGLVIESGISDLAERLLLRVHPSELGCSREDLVFAVMEHFNQTKKMAEYSGPSLFLHAENDHLVGVKHAVANHRAAGSSDNELVLFPFGDHNSIFSANLESYLQVLGGFMRRVCGGKVKAAHLAGPSSTEGKD